MANIVIKLQKMKIQYRQYNSTFGDSFESSFRGLARPKIHPVFCTPKRILLD